MNTVELGIAIVDDDEAVRRALRRLLTSLSYTSYEFSNGSMFLASLPLNVPFCALVDLHMPGLTGLEVVMQMRSEWRSVPAIIITGSDEPGLKAKCLKAGASECLIKPIERANLALAIQSVTHT